MASREANDGEKDEECSSCLLSAGELPERWLAPPARDAFVCIRYRRAVFVLCCVLRGLGTSCSTSFFISMQMTGVIYLTFCPASLSRCLGHVEGHDRVPRRPATRSSKLPSYLLDPVSRLRFVAAFCCLLTLLLRLPGILCSSVASLEAFLTLCGRLPLSFEVARSCTYLKYGLAPQFSPFFTGAAPAPYDFLFLSLSLLRGELTLLRCIAKTSGLRHAIVFRL